MNLSTVLAVEEVEDMVLKPNTFQVIYILSNSWAHLLWNFSSKDASVRKRVGGNSCS